MNRRRTRTIVTVGPATAGESMLRKLKARGADFVRTNMSHSSLDDLEQAIAIAKRVGVPFIIDTEGSQIRTGELDEDVLRFDDDAEVRLRNSSRPGNARELCLRPPMVIEALREGDLIHIDFDTLVLRVCDCSRAAEGFVDTRVVAGGLVGRNKAVVVDPVLPRHFALPALSDKDLKSIELGLREGIEHIAVSFVRSGAAVEEVRRITEGRMKIISKIECTDALESIDDIIELSDALLIDRGDLSKEIPLERIPFAQKIIIERARRHGRDVFVATNLLETMIHQRKPTRAEVQDIVNTILDGASGLTLAAETAIGRYPLDCLNMLTRLIDHTEAVLDHHGGGPCRTLPGLADSRYLADDDNWFSVMPAHGGNLVNRVVDDRADIPIPRHVIRLDPRQAVDLEQIATGAYSPLEGFMGRADLESVVRDMTLADGTIWPLPILLDVGESEAAPFSEGDDVGLVDQHGALIGVLHLEEKYRYDAAAESPDGEEALVGSLYGTSHAASRRPGGPKPVLLAGPVSMIGRKDAHTGRYQLSPRQVRRLFTERGWSRTLGFPTRSMNADEASTLFNLAEIASCDGVLLHALVDQAPSTRIERCSTLENCEQVVQQSATRGNVLLAALGAPRSAGPREALLRAVRAMNFGCTHVTAFGGDAADAASGEVADRLTDLEIEIVDVSIPARR